MPLQWQRRQSIGAVDYGTRGMGMCADPGSYRWCHQALSRSRTSFATSTTEDCCYQIRYNTDTAIASGTEVVAIPKCPFGEQRFQPLSIVVNNVSATSKSSGNLTHTESKASHLYPALVIRSTLQILFLLLLVVATLLPNIAEANSHHNHNSNNIPGKYYSIKKNSLLQKKIKQFNSFKNIEEQKKNKSSWDIHVCKNIYIDCANKYKCWLYSITS